MGRVGSGARRRGRRPKSDPLILARWLAGQDLAAQVRDLVESGITPNTVAEMTPFQAFAVLFEERAETPSGDKLETLYAINLERDAKRERPAVPSWWADHLPRKPR